MGDLLIVIGHALHAAARPGDRRRDRELIIFCAGNSPLTAADERTRTTRRKRGREGGRVSFPHRGNVGKLRQRGGRRHVQLPSTHALAAQSTRTVKQTASTPTTKDRDGTSLRVVWRGVLVQWGRAEEGLHVQLLAPSGLRPCKDAHKTSCLPTYSIPVF